MRKKKKLRRKPNAKAFFRWLFKKNKGLILLFSMLLIVLLINGVTFAWDVTRDSELNKLGTGQFKVHLKEQFKPNFTWTPSTTTKKEVFVVNQGDYEAFVRLSFEEFLLTFKVKLDDETGDLTLLDNERSNLVTFDDVTTWTTVNSSYTYNGNIYEPIASIPANVASGVGEVYDPNSASRASTDLNYFELELGSAFKQNPSDPGVPTSKYWIYGGDGYFYYSEPLKPSKESSILLESIRLSESFPNRLKGSLYKVIIRMDAQQPFVSTLSEWSHDGPTDPVYLMLKDYVKPE